MSNLPVDPEQETSADSSFADILSEFEQAHRAADETGKRSGVVVAVTSDSVVVDVGLKMEGVIPLADYRGTPPKAGEEVQVNITGRNSEGYYLLSKIEVVRPKDWSGLEQASAEKRTIGGQVTAVIKGGLSVDVGGFRAFMPASRSGARDAAEMEQLVGQEIACKIIKLDVAEEDLVVDRRVVLEEEDRKSREKIYTELTEGTVMKGKVRSLTDYGAFVDIGGVDGLLHVADISWARIAKPADVLTVGETVDVQVLKVDPNKKRISLGMKQLQADPWSVAPEKYKTGDRVMGSVTRTTDFGAFVQLEPGLEGLIHLSEMSWSKKIRKPSDVVKPGEQVEVVVLGVNAAEKRISLGLKQALGDPWEQVVSKYPVGSVVEAKVSNLAKFGAFVELGEGIEGMIHVGDLSNEKRINHPQEVLKAGETVKAVVLSIDNEKRRIRLGVKQLQPTSLDEYMDEHKEGDVVTGRVAEVRSSKSMVVDLGEGVQASCAVPASKDQPAAEQASPSSSDISTLTSMLSAKWKQGSVPNASKKESVRSGEIRSFRIIKLDRSTKRIEVEVV